MTALSSDVINVQWEAPPLERRNGIIRRYSCVVTASQPWVNVSSMLQTNATEVNLTELIPYTTYHIRVNAITIVPGPYSISRPCTTLEAGNT